jgi:hypothetical protein
MAKIQCEEHGTTGGRDAAIFMITQMADEEHPSADLSKPGPQI